MKKLFGLLLWVFPAMAVTAQNVGIGTETPAGSARLDIVADDKGLLIPRVALTSQVLATPVTGAVEGLLVYNTNANVLAQGGGGKGFYYWSGSRWENIKTGANAWSLNGNFIGDTATQFLGTTGILPLKFRVNGIKAGSIERFNENLYLGLEAGAKVVYASEGGGLPPERNTFIGSGAGREQITGNSNTYVGAAAGRVANTGFGNTVLGAYAGATLSTGSFNTFVGFVAGGSLGNGGSKNTVVGYNAGSWQENAQGNTFLGHRAGSTSKAGSGNVAVGNDAALSDIFGSGIGNHNVIIGDSSGLALSLANRNTLVGRRSGLALSNGNNNVMVGDSSGYNNTTGSHNTYVGKGARGNSANLQNATAIGHLALAGANNTLVLGSISGVNGATANVNVGIGTTTPTARLQVEGDARISGSVMRPSTGTNNLVPIAYGNIAADGTIRAGTGNFTCTLDVNNVYVIQIAGENYSADAYITQVTPIGTVTRLPMANSNNNRLTVRIFSSMEPGATPLGHAFQFVVFKP